MKKISLIPDWKNVIRYAWSIKFSILAGAFSACEVILAYFPDALPRGTMAGLAGLSAFGGLVTRVMSQKELTDDKA